MRSDMDGKAEAKFPPPFSLGCRLFSVSNQTFGCREARIFLQWSLKRILFLSQRLL